MTRSVAAIQADIERISARMERIQAASAPLADKVTARGTLAVGDRTALDNYHRGIESLDTQLGDLVAELQGANKVEARAYLDRVISEGKVGIEGPDSGVYAPRPSSADNRSPRSPIEATAMRAVAAASRTVNLGVAGERRLEGVIRDSRNDPMGVGARYLAAIANPAYDSAFGKVLADPSFANLSMTPAEQEAMRDVREAMYIGATSLGQSNTGGFAVPFSLDPTVIVTGAGAASSLRERARVVTIAVNEWRGISSDAVEATYEPEFAEVGDDSPTLDDPTIFTEKAQAFVQFSIEIGMDWLSIRSELQRLLLEGKANVEAEKFTHGAGHASAEPEGILTGLAPAQQIPTVLDIDALYQLQEALGPKYQARATWLASLPTINATRRLVASGSTTEPQVFDADGGLLRRPLDELSTLPQDTVLYGDIFAAFTIVDRIGMVIEIVPHLLGPNRRPNGTRGLYAFWRNSSAIVNDDAIVGIVEPS